MKRTELKRKRPLLPGTSVLRRTGWLRRGTGGEGGTVTRLRSTYTGPSRKVCKLVDDRAEGLCEFPLCWKPADDRHHRLNRKSGGRHGEMRAIVNSAAWLLAACRPHHNLVTSATGAVLDEARRIGWVLVEGQDAPNVPVLTRHSERFLLLDNKGDWQYVEDVAA